MDIILFLDCGDWVGFRLGVVPTEGLSVVTCCENEFGVGLAPVHGVDSFGMALVDDYNWTFLVS